jgi:hypothetical protein
MRIEVTQEDIDNGLKGKCDSCAVALAAKRAFGNRIILVDGEQMDVIDNGKWDVLDLPDSAVAFIEAFDTGKPVKPFSFEL